MEELRAIIDTNCPIIYAGNWHTEVAHGWRWALNLALVDPNGKTIVRDYQMAHGVRNVTVGHSFDLDKNLPSPEPAFIGVYVRDVEDLVKEFSRALNDEKAIQQWLTG